MDADMVLTQNELLKELDGMTQYRISGTALC